MIGVFLGIGLILASVGYYFFDKHVVQARLDKPQTVTITRQLAEPYTHPDGKVQTHEAVPAVDPATGQAVVVKPQSSLFFIPTRFWAYILGGIGLIAIVTSLFSALNR